MRAKCFAILLAGFFLCVISYAQDYSIRANRGLNLRAEPSLSAEIAGTVRTGTVLEVVGEQGGWLQINRNRGVVWLASWVNFSHLDSSESIGSQQSTSPVDNCCGIDRQCSNDQEWIAGYWAYQNRQCAAPSQPQPATQTQPGSGAPANVNNCCGIDRQCSSDQEWTNGYWAFQNGQCAAPAQRVTSAPATGGNCCSLGWLCRNEVQREQGYRAYQFNQCAGLPKTSAVMLTGPVPRIEGSSRLVSHITAALKFLKSLAPDWYNYVITGMDSIVEVPDPGLKYEDVCTEPVYDPVTKITTQTCLSGGCTAHAYASERKVTLESCWLDDHGGFGVPYYDEMFTASVLAHEACHIHTHEEGKHFATQEDEEAECDKFATGAGALLFSALATGLDPRHGTVHYYGDDDLGLLRQYCSQGYRADLFCPTLQRLEDIWTNAP